MLLNQLSRVLYEIRSTQITNLYIYIYICLDFIQGACTESLDGQPMKLMTSQSHPQVLLVVL